MARRVIVVDDTDPRYWDPRYSADGPPADVYDEDDAYDDHDDDVDDGPYGGRRGFPVYQPRLPADGIRAVSRRGAIATSWWSKRFLAAIESPETSSRLSRGRSYARSGQVLSLTIASGLVQAKVQGSRRQPYDVVLSVPMLRAKAWDAVVTALSEQAVYSAALLAGQMPDSVEEVFEQLDLSLFPTPQQLNISCSCPDWGNPCKHAAAACYILAERFDADPFTIFGWRGIAQEALLSGIRSHRQRAAGGDPDVVAGDVADDEAELDSFWDCGKIPQLPPVDGGVAGQVIRRLGPTGVVLRGTDLADLLLPAYEAMRQHQVASGYRLTAGQGSEE